MVEAKRNGSIDLIKFLSAVALVFFHGRKLTGGGLFPRGATAVEVFFVIAGFYMARSLERKRMSPFAYIIKRYKEVFPYHVFAFTCAFVYKAFQTGCFTGTFRHGLKEIVLLGIRAVPEFLILPPLAGLQYKMAGINGIEWYLSAMLLGMALLYPLLYKMNLDMRPLVSILICLFLSGILYQLHGSYRITYAMDGLISGGIIRALAMLSLGTASYYAEEAVKKHIRPTRKKRILVSACSVGSWAVVFYYFSSELPTYYEFSVVCFIASGVVLTSLGWTKVNSLLNNRAVYYLGKISFPMFLNQGWIRKVLLYCRIGEKYSYGACMMIFFLCIILSSMLCMIVMDLVTSVWAGFFRDIPERDEPR